MPANATQITPSNTAIVLVDHQPGVASWTNSLPAGQMAANAAILARLGEQMHLPLLISSTRENEGFLGTTIEEIQHAAPVAYENRIRRGGTLDAFGDPAFVDAVKALGRPNLIIAGLTSDVCLANTALSAAGAGYHVHAVADASASTSVLADTVTYDRLRDRGVTVGTTMGTWSELYPDVSTPEGQRSEAAVSGRPVPA